MRRDGVFGVEGLGVPAEDGVEGEESQSSKTDVAKDFEQNLLTEDKVLIEDIEKYMKTQFNSRVKLKLEAKPRVLPSTVLVKTSKGYEYYNIIKY